MSATTTDVLRMPGVTIDLARCEVTRDEETTRLSAIEASLIRYLAQRAPAAVPRAELLTGVWEYRPGLRTRAVDHMVTRLRKKIERDPKNPTLLLSVYGVGYRLELDDSGPPVPAATTPLLGRGHELDHLDTLVDSEARLITLLGPGGIGKTRLAMAFAARRAGEGETRTCDLTQADRGIALVEAVAKTLGVTLTGGQESGTERIGRALYERDEVLLVLDNLEQVAEEAGAILTRWLEAAPGLTILCTSRVQLAVPAEVLMQLDPLDILDAVDLLVDRASRAGATNLTDRVALQHIAARLDGMPLALEIAAARLTLLTPADLVQRLDARLDVSHGAAGRHATLRKTIDWSWDLLDPVEKSAFAQCAVFQQSFTVSAAEAVLHLGSGAPTVEVVLGRLRRHSLLRTVSPGRLGMYETLREYATERLTRSHQHAAVVEAHRRWCVDLASDRSDAHWRGVYDAASDARVLREVPDVLVAIDRSLPHHVDEALAMLRCLPPKTQRSNGVGTTLDRYDRVIRAARAALDPTTVGRALLARATACRFFGRIDDAERDLAEVDLDAIDDALLRGRVVGDRGVLRAYRGNTRGAEQPFMDAVEILDGAGLHTAAGIYRGNLAAIMMMMGRLEDAEGHLLDALDALNGAAPVAPARVRSNLGNLYVILGRPDQADRHYSEAERLARMSENPTLMAQLIGARAGQLLEVGNLAGAGATARHAIDINRRINNVRTVGNTQTILGCVTMERGELAASERHLRRAISVHNEAHDARFAAIAHFSLGRLQWVAGEARAASRTLHRTADALIEVSDPRFARYALATAAMADAELGRPIAPTVERAEELEGTGNDPVGQVLIALARDPDAPTGGLLSHKIRVAVAHGQRRKKD